MVPILTGPYRTKTYKIRLREWGYRKNIVLKDGQVEEVSNALSKQAQDPNSDIRLEDGSIVARGRLATQYACSTTCLSATTCITKRNTPCQIHFSAKECFCFMFSLNHWLPSVHVGPSVRKAIRRLTIQCLVCDEGENTSTSQVACGRERSITSASLPRLQVLRLRVVTTCPRPSSSSSETTTTDDGVTSSPRQTSSTRYETSIANTTS